MPILRTPSLTRTTSGSAPVWTRIARATPLGGAVMILVACGASNVRPHLAPLPGAVTDTVHADPDAVILAAARLVARQGFTLRRASPQEGYLETNWFDVKARRPGGGNTLDVHHAVRLRFWADSMGLGDTEVVGEAVFRRTADPSVPAELAEMMAPDGHPGREILIGVLDSLRARYAR